MIRKDHSFFSPIATRAAIENITIMTIPNTTDGIGKVLSSLSSEVENDVNETKISAPAIIVTQICRMSLFSMSIKDLICIS